MQRIYCCEQNPHEPLPGTADQVDVWLLLEYRPVWKARAVEDSALGTTARRWLERTRVALAERGLKARPQLIRQPEIDSDQVRLLVAVPDTLLRFAGRGYDFLERVDVPVAIDDPAAHETLAEPHYFVCTNGQRDLCCARFGLPVYDGLRERVGARVWQTTHLGGHRFAANVLTLPQGAVYGRVGLDDLDDLVAAVEADRLLFPRLRGRAWYPPSVQAAEALSGRSNLRFSAMEGDDASATVRFSAADGEVEVRVQRAAPIEVQKSCGDEAPGSVTPFQAG